MKLFKKLHWSFFKGYSMFCRWRWAQIVWSLFWGLGTFFLLTVDEVLFCNVMCKTYIWKLLLVLLLKFIKIFCHSFPRKVYQTEPSIMTCNLSYVPHYRYADISEWLNSDIFIILKFIQWHLKLNNPWHINPFVLLCPVICFQHWSSLFQSSQNLFKDV